MVSAGDLLQRSQGGLQRHVHSVADGFRMIWHGVASALRTESGGQGYPGAAGCSLSLPNCYLRSLAEPQPRSVGNKPGPNAASVSRDFACLRSRPQGNFLLSPNGAPYHVFIMAPFLFLLSE